MKQWYEEMFENSADAYDKDLKEWYEKLSENSGAEHDKEPHIKRTEGEVDFIESELAFDTRATILDIELAKGVIRSPRLICLRRNWVKRA
jgi:hypothetical protein